MSVNPAVAVFLLFMIVFMAAVVGWNVYRFRWVAAYWWFAGCVAFAAAVTVGYDAVVSLLWR